MAGANLIWEKSIVGWLLVAGLFWEKEYCWLVADKPNEEGVNLNLWNDIYHSLTLVKLPT
jgi:hypothetical protein